MYYIKKRLEIAGSHSLKLDYQSKCSNIHGHNWIIILEFKGMYLNKNGMLIDFTEIKKSIIDLLDHKHINDVLPNINPTAENLARCICEMWSHCIRVTVIESENNEAIYERD